jgi:hypothetical protein
MWALLQSLFHETKYAKHKYTFNQLRKLIFHETLKNFLLINKKPTLLPEWVQVMLNLTG